MAKLSAEAKVGLLVIVGSLVLLYMTFAVGKYEFGEKKGYVLRAAFDSVAGIDAKAAVRMAGVKIGSVEKVGLEDSHAVVTMRIDPGVHILRSSEAMIKTMGLLGEKYVEFVPLKTEQARKLAPGETAYYRNGEQVRITVSPSDVDKLINQLSDISDDVKQITGSLRQVIGTEQGTRSMEDILNDVRQTTANIKDFSTTLQTDGSELVMRLNELAENLNGVVGENRDNLRATMENVREASKSAETALASIDNAARKIDTGEGTIGKLLNNDSMYNNINTAAQGLTDYVSRVERMKTIVGFRSQYMFPKSQSYATLELKPRPDTYYIFEVTDDPFGNYTRTVTTTSPGNTVVQETYEDKFKFSLEFAKRWGNLALRFGLIESTGGVGADYFAYDDRLKFSIDAWNFNSTEPNNENAHLKATANYNINKVLFVNAGYDNMLNVHRALPFVGLGLRFDDEDLKYLLGSVPIPK
ncbi:MAG TPA: MlaD family protein [Nitrospirota bacterium]|nr:MlaD family protein [Nitrospirota bacterium]